MDTILYFFRDTVSGVHYFIYAFLLLFFLFAIIGYLFKQKYGKVEIKLNTSQPSVEPSKIENINQVNKKLTHKEQKALKKQQKQKQISKTVPVPNQSVKPVSVAQPGPVQQQGINLNQAQPVTKPVQTVQPNSVQQQTVNVNQTPSVANQVANNNQIPNIK